LALQPIGRSGVGFAARSVQHSIGDCDEARGGGAVARNPPMHESDRVLHMRTFRALRLAAALAVGLACMAPAARAGEPPTAEAKEASEAAEAARELLALMSKEMIASLVEQATSRMWPAIESRLRAYNPSVDPTSLSGLRVELERIQQDYMLNVVQGGPEIYARHFTAGELREIIAFYRTPVGAKLLAMTPRLTAEVTDMIAPHMPKFFEKTMEAFAKVLRAKGYAI
jgi:uncharacterized protein